MNPRASSGLKKRCKHRGIKPSLRVRRSFTRRRIKRAERKQAVIKMGLQGPSGSGNKLSLSLGGVRSYNLENLYGRKCEERFKVFVDFQNHVCTNLCVSTNGFKDELRVRTLAELLNRVYQLFAVFNIQSELCSLENLSEFSLSEHQFASLVGRLRMYQYLKPSEKAGIPALMLGDS